MINKSKWEYEESHANHLAMVLMVHWLLANPGADWCTFVNRFPNLPFDAYERVVATATKFTRMERDEPVHR